MRIVSLIILSFFLSSIIIAQEVTLEELNTNQQLMIERVSKLASLTSDLLHEVDSLKTIVNNLKNEIERSKWNLMEQGMTSEKVLSILGASTKVEEASFGYKKLIFGEGYSGYVLFDKEMKCADWSPPLHLRMNLNK